MDHPARINLCGLSPRFGWDAAWNVDQTGPKDSSSAEYRLQSNLERKERQFMKKNSHPCHITSAKVNLFDGNRLQYVNISSRLGCPEFPFFLQIGKGDKLQPSGGASGPTLPSMEWMCLCCEFWRLRSMTCMFKVIFLCCLVYLVCMRWLYTVIFHWTRFSASRRCCTDDTVLLELWVCILYMLYVCSTPMFWLFQWHVSFGRYMKYCWVSQTISWILAGSH